MTKIPKTAKTAAVAAALTLTLSLLQGVASGEPPWRKNFDEACSRTTIAMTLSEQELNALLEKCDALQKVIESQEESVAKVYLKRLQMCRNLYAYVLDYKKSAQSSKN